MNLYDLILSVVTKKDIDKLKICQKLPRESFKICRQWLIQYDLDLRSHDFSLQETLVRVCVCMRIVDCKGWQLFLEAHHYFYK